MAKVIKQHQQTFPQYTHHSTGNGGVAIYPSRTRSGFLRAPKRSIPQHRHYSSRARREQKLQPNVDGKFRSPDRKSTTIVNSSTPSSDLNSEVERRGYDLTDNKRARPEDDTQETQQKCSFSAPAGCYSSGESVQPVGSRYLKPQVGGHSYMFCKLSLVDKMRLRELLTSELNYHPNNAFLYYVNPEVDDKVDVALRNEAVQNLRFLHNAFFNLTTDTFCKAINLIDRFIVKVKVKPKYMACVATASYCLASRLTNCNSKNFGLPDTDTVVAITRCGGNAADLMRMEEILASKLGHDLDGVNAFDFLQLFVNCVVRTIDVDNVNVEDELDSDKSQPITRTNNSESDATQTEEDIVTTTDNDKQADDDSVYSKGIQKLCAARGTLLYKRLATLMEIALCSLEVYRFRPACLSLAIIAQIGVEGLMPLAKVCGVDWYDVCACANLVGQLYDIYYHDLLPNNRRQFGWIWAHNRRNCRIGYSSPTPLDTISEDYEPADEEEWLLSLLIEP